MTLDPGLAPTPPMGFNTWNCFRMGIDEEIISGTLGALVDSGLAELGYRALNIDDGWMAPERDRNGRLVPDPDRFPGGILRLADAAHEAGLTLGIYSDCGERTCGGLPASYGHDREDAESFASWEVDFLKHDWCNVPFDDFPGRSERQVAEELYGRMSDAIAATGRPMVLSLCSWGHGEPWQWARGVGHLWRTTPDICDRYREGAPAGMASLTEIFHRNVALDQHAGPGGWNDPDMLEIGNGGMTEREYRSHFTLWCLMAAPLLIGTDLRSLSAETLTILGNRDLIAVDQDPMGRQCRLVSSESSVHVLVKELQGGTPAVGAFNEGDEGTTVSLDWPSLVGGGSHGALARDLWSGEERPTGASFEVRLEPHECAAWRLVPKAAGA